MTHLLDDVVTEAGGKRLTDGTVGEVKGDVLEGLNHASATEPTQVTAIAGGTVLRLLLGQLLEVGTSLEQVINRVDLSLADGLLLFGSILGEQLEDVLGVNIVAHAGLDDADHVDAIVGADRLGNLTYRGGIYSVLEFIGEHIGCNKAIMTVVTNL